MRNYLVAIGPVLLASAGARGQSINLAVGPPAEQPSAAYAAAGLPGYWNAIPAYNNTYAYNLRKLDGTVTGVYVWQYGGTDLRNSDDPATSGDDARLMDHCQVTYTSGLETCLFFRQLEYGEYEVLVYAWMPNQPAVRAYTSSDEEPGFPHRIVGGAWPGHQQEWVTYARLRCIVGPPEGLLRVHSGIVPGDPPALGAACNGIQLRKLPPRSLGDMNCDGSVNGGDVNAFAAALIAPSAYYAQQPACRIDNADLNGDGQIGPADRTVFVAALLGGP